MSERPLVVSLRLDEPTQARFDDERRALFPPGRTAVGAHVTLFHALPAGLRDDVAEELAGVPGPLAVEVVGLLALGRGVAYALDVPGLADRHAQWQRRWREHLTRQDAQPWRPHVTVQNKLSPEVAAATLARLRDGFAPWTARGQALELWEYAGGPWSPLAAFPLLR